MTSPARRSPLARIGVAIVVEVAVAAMSAPVASPVNAQTTEGGDVRLELLDQEFSLEPDGVIHLEYRLTGLVGDPLELDQTATDTLPTAPTDPAAGANSQAPAPEPVALAVEVTNYLPLTDPADVERVVGSDVDPDGFDDVSNAIDGIVIDLRPLATRDADGSVRFVLDIPTDVSADSGPESLRFSRAGMSPLRVRVTADNSEVATAGTVVQRLPDATEEPLPPPIDLAVVLGAPDPGPQATPEEVSAATADLRTVTEISASLDGVPVTVEAPPTLIAGAATTPQDAAALATALDDAELVATPVVPLDVSSAVAAGRAEVYTRLLIAGSEMLTEAVPTTPIRRDVWIARSALSADGAQHLRELGVRYVIVPDEVYGDMIDRAPPEHGLFVEAPLPDGGRMPLLVVDDLSADLAPTAADAILAEATATEWAVQAAAEMLVEQAVDDGRRAATSLGPPAERSRILSTPDLLVPDERLIDGLVQLAASTPSLRLTAASALTGVTDVEIEDGRTRVVELPDRAGPSLTERIELIDATALNLASVASMLPEDDPRPALWTAQLDTLISTGYSDADVVDVTTELISEADQLREAVVLPEPSNFTLTGRSGIIDIRVRNTSDETLAVVLHLESPKINFSDGDQTVELAPDTDTMVSVPVDALSNGTSSIELSVLTPAGEPLGEPVELTARVTGLTGLGQVLTGGFILVLLTWWFSHWRARRRAEQPAEEAEDVDAGDDLEQDHDQGDAVSSETL